MPDKPASERTEKPTPERLRKARQEGQITESREVPSALMMVALLIVLGLSAPTVYRWFTVEVRQGLSLHWTGPMTEESVGQMLRVKATGSLTTMMPFLVAAAAASVLGSLLVGGWAFAPKAVQFRLDRISPVQGFKRLLSLRSIVTLLVCLAKLGVLAMLVWYYLRDRMDEVLRLHWATPERTVAVTARLIFGLVARVAIALAAIAGLDLLFQRWKHRRDLRMTRQELKEERKQYEISPEVRGRIRAIQIQMARKRMLQEVPKADVVLVNPDHVAVALAYDSAAMASPQLVAKGTDFLCQKIKEIARAHGVPVVHRPELARALYATTDVGQEIPQTLFVAVAEVLAMIYRMHSKRSGTAARGKSES